MTVLLDSTALISSLRGEASGVAVIRKLLRRGDMLATSAINVGEVYSGAHPKEIKDIEQLFAELEIYPVTFAIGRRAGELRNAAARKGRTVSLDDMVVAATSLAYECALLTDNRKDFDAVEGLRLFDLT